MCCKERRMGMISSRQWLLSRTSAMGTDLDTRAWEKIAASLGTVEYDERGSARHDAFAAYADYGRTTVIRASTARAKVRHHYRGRR